ncbi:14529_t:CDS:2 [Cetraspora pellucida]|uniref:14529_t:CDS:1 n=1 Tax=Cetraspora pellucida TaxID=1433469 RepID=A0A9N9HQ20_9GLOM|nr:14529_t:CDS:2 [Cetraspora pellucida]
MLASPSVQVDIELETRKYVAVSPEGDFVVEFVVKENFEFELKIHITENLNNKDVGDRISSKRKLSGIPTTFEFTKEQLDIIKNESTNILRWSVAVSDKSASLPEFRILAISYVNLEDMKYYKKNSSEIHLSETKNNGFTFVFIIADNYSISNIEEKSLIEYGGIVELFSSQNADEYFFIILTLSGICKYHIKDESINDKNLQRLKYPRRTYNAIINNINARFDDYDFDKACHVAYNSICEYIESCLHKHYFLVDTIKEGIEYMELYDLKTNQLVNIFKRQNLDQSVLLDLSTLSYAISDDNRLLAYVPSSTGDIIIYSVESGIEIAKIEHFINIKDAFGQIFIDFFGEKLLIYHSKDEWFVWDIFGSLRDSVKLGNPGFTVELPLAKKFGVQRSNSSIVVDIGSELVIYDDQIIDKYLQYLKKNGEQHWKQLPIEYFSMQNLYNYILNLHNRTSIDKLDKYFSRKSLQSSYKNITLEKLDIAPHEKLNLEALDKNYVIIEPWSTESFGSFGRPRYSFYLDEEKKKLLLIGSHTIQVWHRYDQGHKKKRSLEFIHIPLSHLHNIFELEMKKLDLQVIKVIDFKYCTGKFKLSIQINDEYFSAYKKLEQFLNKDKKLKFNDIIKQTRKIIFRFIRLHPTAWRLLDIRFDLMSVLIETGDYELVYSILSSKKLTHVPQYLSWSGGKNTIRTALSDRNMLALLLDYYTKHAEDNIGWMNTVADVLPELYKSNKTKEEKKGDKIGWMNKVVESYTYYAQMLFYNSRFGDKRLDLLSFEFLKISPELDGLLKVFIPITQLIPQDSELDLQEIDSDKIDDIRMVPLPDFTTNKRMLSDVKEGKLTNYLKFLIFATLEEQDYSPFIKIIKDVGLNILCENPSMGAIMNWMWYSSKFILLGYSSYIGLSQKSIVVGGESNNPFSSIIGSMLAVYNWSSMSLDTWNFWPLTVISVIGSFIFVIILQNVIISFMSEAISHAVNNSRGIYSYQVDFIYDFALLERSLELNEIDSKFKDKLNAKYICYSDDPSITDSWKKKSEQMKLKLNSKLSKLRISDFETWTTESCEFIWKKEIETVDSPPEDND